jgi:anthranilate synthase/aminodeoxychorismate synthase-like glutamine amidotransferase
VLRVLFVDHEDSFAWNLVALLRELACHVDVVRPERLAAPLPPFDRLVLGPGPGGPDAARASLALLTRVGPHLPTLGVCLGQQILARACGGVVGLAHEPVHGHADPLHHDGRGLFAGLTEPFLVGRYHSLVAHEPLPEVLEVSARSPAGEVMALRHRHWPVEAVQFHPESVLSEHGQVLVSNFLGGAIGGAAPARGAVHSGQGPLEARRGSDGSMDVGPPSARFASP